MKTKNKVQIILILLSIILCSNQVYSQDLRTIKVDILVGKRRFDFSKGFQLLITIKGKKTYPLLYLNGFVVPDFEGASQADDVCFIYKGKEYHFYNVSTSKFDTDWTFNTDSEDGDQKGFSLDFEPKHGDGTSRFVSPRPTKR